MILSPGTLWVDFIIKLQILTSASRQVIKDQNSESSALLVQVDKKVRVESLLKKMGSFSVLSLAPNKT